jgi:hypothetical protein
MKYFIPSQGPKGDCIGEIVGEKNLQLHPPPSGATRDA